MTLFVRLAGVEVANNYGHTVCLQEIAVRVFNQATEKEIVPTEIRTLTVEGNMQIEARSRQQYKIQVHAFFSGMVRADGTELFLTVTTAEHASLRAKLDLLSESVVAQMDQAA